MLVVVVQYECTAGLSGGGGGSCGGYVADWGVVVGELGEWVASLGRFGGRWE